MENTKRNTVYRVIMLILITAIITFMITSLGMYNYFIKSDNGQIKTLVKYIEISKQSDTISERIEAVKKYLEEHYIGELNEENMIETAIKGYVAGVDDEYTEYLMKDEYEELLFSVTGDFIGIGIYMTQDSEGNIIVIMPMENSPALEAGLKSGDIIQKINGEECKGMDLNLVSTKVKGEEGTEVELEILRDNETLTKKIVRRDVEIQTSASKILDGNIGYIELTTFDENCTERIKGYLNDFQSKNVKSVILDLRNNTGGMVSEAISLSGLFIPENNIIMRSYDKQNEEKIIKSDNKQPINMKVIVLVNEYSASATEIVAAALKDNNVATIVGTNTFGKGVMQEVIPLFEGGLKVTIEEFKTPNGDIINKKGIEPNEVIEDNPETKTDEQLQKAIELLK